MKNLRLFAFVTGSLVVASAFVLGACGDDDGGVIVPPDGGPDTSKPDTSTPDVDVPDTNKPDTNKPDTFVPDAGTTLQNFANFVANALCDTLTRCCYGQTSVPDGGALDGGGTFNRNKCVQVYSDLGFEESLLGDDAIPKGSVTLDQSKADDCIAKIKALQCNLTGVDLEVTRTSCYSALTGKVTNGQPCRGSIECVTGHYCHPDADAGAVFVDGGGSNGAIGTCKPLVGNNGNCNIVDTGDDINDSFRAEQACSYRASGDTNLRCSSYDPTSGNYNARADWKCAATVPNGQGCNSTVWCSDGICDPTNDDYICRSPVIYFTPASCTGFKN